MAAPPHLHCLGHRVKYGSPEVGYTTQQFCQKHDRAAVLTVQRDIYDTVIFQFLQIFYETVFPLVSLSLACR